MLITRFYQRADVLAHHQPHDGAGLENVHDTQWHVMVATQDQGRSIHDIESLVQCLIISQSLIQSSGWILHRVGSVDPIHLGGLDQQFGIDLDGSEAGRRIGGEEGITGAGREDDHPTFFQMPYGAAADVILAHLVNLECGHDPDWATVIFQCVLHGECVEDGRQHSHIVAGDPFQSFACRLCTANDVATPHHQPDLNAGIAELGNLEG